MAAYTSIAAWQAAQSVGGGAERLWYHDWRLDSDADYDASPLSSIDGLTVSMSSNGEWGPNGGLGLRVIPAKAGSFTVTWANIGADLMQRPLAHGDALVFELQHALASNPLTGDNSMIIGQVEPNSGYAHAYAGLFRQGGFSRNMRFRDNSGWPAGNSVLSDTYVGYRSTSHWVRTGATDVYCSTAELSADAPLSGTEGPFCFDIDGATYTKNSKTASKCDFSTAAGNFKFYMENAEGGGVPVRMEAAAIWLIPGTPNSA